MSAFHIPCFSGGDKLTLISSDTSAIGQWPVPGTIVQFGLNRLASDPLYTVALTFSGVHAGSEIRIYDTYDSGSANELAGIESCAANQALYVNYYGGSTTVYITIVHMSYDPIVMSIVVPAMDSSIPIQQQTDRWYSNP